MRNNHFCYEQPVNELSRIFLRIEYLDQLMAHRIENRSAWDSHAALIAIIDTVNILDRPDLRSKLTKELYRYNTSLTRLRQSHQINQEKLDDILAHLKKMVDILHTSSGKLGQGLRDNEFLSNIRHHLLTPGGTCNFDTPAYHLWLSLPTEKRVEHLLNWQKELLDIQVITSLILQMIRESGVTEPKTAVKGFFQGSLDPTAPCQLVRVHIPQEIATYPEISVGRHGLSVRLFKPDYCARPSQLMEDVTIKVTYCII